MERKSSKPNLTLPADALTQPSPNVATNNSSATAPLESAPQPQRTSSILSRLGSLSRQSAPQSTPGQPEPDLSELARRTSIQHPATQRIFSSKIDSSLQQHSSMSKTKRHGSDISLLAFTDKLNDQWENILPILPPNYNNPSDTVQSPDWASPEILSTSDKKIMEDHEVQNMEQVTIKREASINQDQTDEAPANARISKVNVSSIDNLIENTTSLLKKLEHDAEEQNDATIDKMDEASVENASGEVSEYSYEETEELVSEIEYQTGLPYTQSEDNVLFQSDFATHIRKTQHRSEDNALHVSNGVAQQEEFTESQKNVANAISAEFRKAFDVPSDSQVGIGHAVSSEFKRIFQDQLGSQTISSEASLEAEIKQKTMSEEVISYSI